MPTRIDAHHHLWRLARGDYAWLQTSEPALAPIRRDVEPAELAPLLAAHEVTATVLVQATDTEAETDFLLDLAGRCGWVAGVTGWIDLADPSREGTLERWARDARFKAVRPMLQDLPDAGWIAQAPAPAMVDALVRLGLRFEALVKPPQLRPLLEFVERWPALPIVVDHAAKPVLREGWQAPWVRPWEDGMAALASDPRIHCKLSGLLTEAAPAQVAATDAALAAVRPVWDRLLRWFGPGRLIWGSDWPVLTLAAGYERWVEVCERLLEDLAPPERDAIRRGNAARFYAIANAGRA